MLSQVDELTKSLKEYIRDFLDSNGYSGLYLFADEYPGDRQNPLDKTIVVLGHDESAAIVEGELGGPLAFEEITYNCDVLGETGVAGRNIASLIKRKLEDGEPIPLYDYSSSTPIEVDKIPYVDGAIHSRLRFPNPYPWQQHWNVVTFSVTLEYNRSAL
jgi:hypothetical protein